MGPHSPHMSIQRIVSADKVLGGKLAAARGAELIRSAVTRQGFANVIVATGASQFEMLQELTEETVPWERVTFFHLDEYVGVPVTHPASFRKYLWERFQSRLPTPVRSFVYVDGEGDVMAECRRLGEWISRYPIDVCFAGIGENGHLAFNDPPADFDAIEPYLVVELDEACRRQQLGEGWFGSLEEVPSRAISMSIRQIMKSRSIILTVPDQRKAEAVANSLEGPVTNLVPASILQKHDDVTIYLDPASASLLKGE